MPGISQVGPLPDQAESATEWAQPSPRQIAQIAQICITAALIGITAGTCGSVGKSWDLAHISGSGADSGLWRGFRDRRYPGWRMTRLPID
jgi:hypothetical protein